MKKFVCQFLIGCGLLAAAATAQEPTYLPPPSPDPSPMATDVAARATQKPVHLKKVILVGDSTTQVGSGWGGAFCAHHLISFVSCINLALGGRSTLSYRAEGTWNVALSEMKTPGYEKIYVLIQFGHNDQPGKPGRSTDLYREFPANLARFVTEARAAGAIPVLLTPLTRRSFKDGSVQDALHAWADATRKVAHDMNVPLVDLHAVSLAAIQKMGPVAELEMAEMAPPPAVLAAAKTGTTIDVPPPAASTAPAAPNSTEVEDTPQAKPLIVFDYTHLGDKGADYFSAMVARELARVVPDLRQQIYP